jgi:hypothetical protein
LRKIIVFLNSLRLAVPHTFHAHLNGFIRSAVGYAHFLDIGLPKPVRAPGDVAAGYAYSMPRLDTLVAHFAFCHLFYTSLCNQQFKIYGS